MDGIIAYYSKNPLVKVISAKKDQSELGCGALWFNNWKGTSDNSTKQKRVMSFTRIETQIQNIVDLYQDSKTSSERTKWFFNYKRIVEKRKSITNGDCCSQA